MGDDDELIRAMYEQPDDIEDDGQPKEQPIQLRLAGKATIVTMADRQVAIPKIEYVEMLEKRIMDMEATLVEYAALIKKQGVIANRNASMTSKRITDLASRVVTRKGS